MNTCFLFQWVANPIVTALGAGFAAWFGGRLGVRNAIEKLKKERIFERRLKWYEETINRCRKLSAVFAQYALASDRNETAEVAALRPNIEAALQEFYESVAGSYLYAPNQMVIRIHEVLAKWTKLLFEFADRISRQDFSNLSAHITGIGESLNKLQLDLSDSMRMELGDDKLDHDAIMRILMAGLPPVKAEESDGAGR